MAETQLKADSGGRPLVGQTALVTGAAKRIGRAIALELARAGADVAITYLSSENEAQQTLKALLDLGVRAFGVRADLTSADEIRVAANAVLGEFGGLTILV